MPRKKLQSKIDILNIEEKQNRSNIEDSEILIVAGRGIKRKEDISLLQELAELLNGKVAATRAVVEAGWIKPEYQIGLSGRTVKPKLIITCGVSGAIQFLSGMKSSDFIVAVNSDPDAPIFKTAHVGLVGDLYTIIPEMIQQLKSR